MAASSQSSGQDKGPVYISGPIFKIEQQGGSDYTVTQVVEQDSNLKRLICKTQYYYNYIYGPWRWYGWYDVVTFEIIIIIIVLGVRIGTFFGHAGKGFTTTIDTPFNKSTSKFSIKNESEVWVEVRDTGSGKESVEEHKIFPPPPPSKSVDPTI